MGLKPQQIKKMGRDELEMGMSHRGPFGKIDGTGR